MIPVGGAVVTNIDAGVSAIGGRAGADCPRAGQLHAARAGQSAHLPRRLVGLWVDRQSPAARGDRSRCEEAAVDGADARRRSRARSAATPAGGGVPPGAGAGVEGADAAAAAGTGQAALRGGDHRASGPRRCRPRHRYQAFRRALEAAPAIDVLPYPTDGTCIKAPIVVRATFDVAHQRALDRMGVGRAYDSDYPTSGDPAYPRSNRFFDLLFTLPLHRYIDDAAVEEIARTLTAAARQSR